MELSQQHSWPLHFPRTCPPEDAVAASGIFYRLITGNCEVDFVSHYLRGLAEKSCKACGLSVYADRTDLERLKRLVKGLRTAQVGTLCLDPNAGQLRHTPPRDNPNSHHTWWVPESVDASAYLMPIK